MLGDLSGKSYRRITQKNGLIVVVINGLIRMDFKSAAVLNNRKKNFFYYSGARTKSIMFLLYLLLAIYAVGHVAGHIIFPSLLFHACYGPLTPIPKQTEANYSNCM